MKRRLTHALGAGLLAIILSACAGDAGGGAAAPVAAIDGIDERRVQVVTTTNFVTDLVEQVGGDRVTVHGLMGAGVDPHLYKASAGDVARIGNADVVFLVGLHLEARMADVLERTAHRRPVIAVGEVLDEAQLLQPTASLAAGGAEHDPHIWFDPQLWAQTPAEVARVLGALDPGHAEAYEQRADAYAAEVRDAGERAERQLARVPRARRVLVTSHDAFRYLGRAFEVEVQAVQGISTVAEATTRDIDRIASLLVERDVRAVFVESSVPRQTLDAVVAAARDKGGHVRIGAELFSDAAGDEGTPEGTWVGMLGHNVDAIVEGLQ